MYSLPGPQDFETFQAWRADGSQCLPAALDIARSHGLPHADPHVFSTGTNLVVGLDDRLILKIFRQCCAASSCPSAWRWRSFVAISVSRFRKS
jgi:hypothetical protein